jgi:hypothetical protein
MPQANHDPTATGAPIHRLTAREIEALADRLFSRGISVLSIDQPQVRADLIEASRKPCARSCATTSTPPAGNCKPS